MHMKTIYVLKKMLYLQMLFHKQFYIFLYFRYNDSTLSFNTICLKIPVKYAYEIYPIEFVLFSKRRSSANVCQRRSFCCMLAMSLYCKFETSRLNWNFPQLQNSSDIDCQKLGRWLSPYCQSNTWLNKIFVESVKWFSQKF